MSQIRSWRPEIAAVASDGVVAANLRFDVAMGEAGRQVDAALVGWQGSAASAYSLRAFESTLAGNHIGVAVLDIADALADAGALAGVCAAVREIEEDAGANGCVVLDDGTVRAPRADSGNAALDLALQACFDAQALSLQARLIPLLESAAETDRVVGGRLAASVQALESLRGEPRGGLLSQTVIDILAGDAFLPEDPKALCALWESLTPADKDALFAYDPLLGNRDGIPAVARDFFNRDELPRLRAGARSELAALEAQHPDWASGANMPDTLRGWNRLHDWDVARQEIQTRLAGYESVATEITGGGPARYLLGLDDRGNGALALNNPDSARNVATLVPGTDSPLSSIGQGITRAGALHEAAAKADRSARTSVIAWYGYAAPAWVGQALLDRYADVGSTALDHFGDGLRATHTSLPAHNTVIGHSYGSTLIGVAASHGGSLAADDVVFVGSPGVEVRDVSELRLDGIAPERNHEHVFATADAADPIAAFGRYAHGVNPVDPGFGATVFASSGATVDVPLLRSIPVDLWSHSNYWDARNPGLTTQGEIIADAYKSRP